MRVLALGHNTGFAHAANRGVGRASGEFVALVNTDVVLEPRLACPDVAGARGEPRRGRGRLQDARRWPIPRPIYDAGDILRRDGACEQRGRFMRDDGRWEQPGEVFGACAGAALYRRSRVLELGGFDERYFAYLEDVDLALRLRCAGWRCRYEPAVALHAGEGSSHRLAAGTSSSSLATRWCSWPRRFRSGGCPMSPTGSWLGLARACASAACQATSGLWLRRCRCCPWCCASGRRLRATSHRVRQSNWLCRARQGDGHPAQMG